MDFRVMKPGSAGIPTGTGTGKALLCYKVSFFLYPDGLLRVMDPGEYAAYPDR